MIFLQSINTVLQQILPGHLLSRTVGLLAFCEEPRIKNFLIQQFIQRFDIQMHEVAEQSFDTYPHFNAFFTRALKDGIRPMAGNGHLASPVDGTVLSGGDLGDHTQLAAKGHHFSLSELLGTDTFDSTYINGQYLTIYLSPKDYHRVHGPFAAELKHMTYVPGRLFSVNKSTTTSIKAVFARNERVIMHFKSDKGPFVVAMIGAMLVASIATPFDGVIMPPGQNITHWNYYCGPHRKFQQGDEIGRFQYGSTVIVILPKGKNFHPDIQDGQTIQLGESLGNF